MVLYKIFNINVILFSDEDENESFNVFKTSIPFYDLIDVLKFGKDLYLSLNKKLQIN